MVKNDVLITLPTLPRTGDSEYATARRAGMAHFQP